MSASAKPSDSLTRCEQLLALAPAFLEAAPDATVIVDEAGRIVLVNRQTEVVFGYDRAELFGQTVEMLMPARHAAGHVQRRAAFHADPHVRSMGEVRQELLGRRKDGSEFPVDINLSPLATADGTLVMSTIRDVSRHRRMEQELRESERLLRSIAENVPHAYLSVINRDLTVGFTSGQELKVQQLDPAAFVGKAVREVFAPFGDAVVATMHAAYERTFAGTEQSFELRLNDQDQLYKTVPLPTADGAVHQILVVVENVTARKQTQAALRASKEHLRQILDSLFAFVAVTTPDGVMVDCNQAPLDALGLRKEAVIGRPFADGPWFLPETREEVRNIIRRAAAGEIVRAELPVFIAGQVLRFENVWSPLRDADGRVVQVVASGVNVTVRHENAARLEALTGWQKAILENAAYAIIATTPEGIIQTFNPAASRMLGYAPEEMVGGVTPEVFHDRVEVEERARQFSAELGTAIAPGFEAFVARARRNLPNDYEWTYIRKDGSRFPVLLSVTALRDAAGGITGFLGIARDVTDQRRLEGELRHMQKMEAIGQLSAGVAHDFNNLLTVIQGHVALLDGPGTMSTEARGSVGEIKDAADRAANLTRQLLTFSRRQAMRARPLDLNEVVAAMARMLQRILGEDIRMELHLSSQEVMVFADASMIEQVLLNLVVNSRDAMPRGGRLVIETTAVEFDDTITARVPQARAGAFVCLATSDTGTGISADVLPRIFEPFFTTKALGKGTGLGLATVYGIVQQHHGWIVVDSEVGRGTTFRIHLPRSQGAKVAPPPCASALALHGGDETILLVEDEPALRALSRSLLVSLGYCVLEAASGPQALEVWRVHAAEIDLLVTDIVMPDGMSGFELGERLTHEAPDLPVIYTTGYSPEIGERQKELVAGVNFLAKPFELGRLLQTIRAALDRAAR